MKHTMISNGNESLEHNLNSSSCRIDMIREQERKASKPSMAQMQNSTPRSLDRSSRTSKNQKIMRKSVNM